MYGIHASVFNQWRPGMMLLLAHGITLGLKSRLCTTNTVPATCWNVQHRLFGRGGNSGIMPHKRLYPGYTKQGDLNVAEYAGGSKKPLKIAETTKSQPLTHPNKNSICLTHPPQVSLSLLMSFSLALEKLLWAIWLCAEVSVAVLLLHAKLYKTWISQ